MVGPPESPRWEPSLEDPTRTPTSVLVYARSRADLDPVMADVAGQVHPDGVWIEVAEGGSPEPVEEQPPTTVSAGFSRRFEFEPSELLPDHGRANLLLWGAGRPAGESSFVRDLEDLTWLPESLIRAVPEVRLGEAPTPVVVARAELLVQQLPHGVEDVARLLAVLERRRVTLIAGLLFRPFAEFSQRFHYVYRVRPAAPGTDGTSRVIREPPVSS